MDEYPDKLPSFHWLCVCLFVAGATWAAAMLPMFLDSTMHPARVAVGGTVIMAVALIYSMLAPLKKVGMALAAGFLSTMAVGLTFITGAFSFGATISTFGMGLALVAFSVATSRQKEATAATLVDNRHLEVALTQSLEEAEYLATRDPLTGMLNRRAFFKAEQHPTLRNGVVQHLLTIDLDHFKQVNDVHGHDMGDRVLVKTAEQIRKSLDEIPGSGHCGCRFGGEEFVIFVDGVDPMAMRRAAEGLRRRIRSISSQLGMEGRMKVSASIGIAKLGSDECFDDALRRLDSAMYRAKDRGRDRVELAA